MVNDREFSVAFLDLRIGGAKVDTQDLVGVEVGHLVVELRDLVGEEYQQGPAPDERDFREETLQSLVRLGVREVDSFLDAWRTLALLLELSRICGAGGQRGQINGVTIFKTRFLEEPITDYVVL